MERPREGGVIGLVVGVVRANHLTLEGTQIMGGLWKGSLRARCAQGIRINDRAVSRGLTGVRRNRHGYISMAWASRGFSQGCAVEGWW